MPIARGRPPSRGPDAGLLLETVPRWSWPGEAATNTSFYVAHSRGLRFVQTDARGEGFVKDVFRLLASGCATDASPPTIVDVGANTGYYSMLASVFGCPVIAFEPQPGCLRSFELARARNRLGIARVRYVPQPLSSRPRGRSEKGSPPCPQRAVWLAVGRPP